MKHNLTESINHIAAIISNEGNFLYANDKYLEFSGYSVSELKHTHFLKVIDELDRDFLNRIHVMRFQDNPSPFHYRYRYKKRDNTIHLVNVTVLSLTDINGILVILEPAEDSNWLMINDELYNFLFYKSQLMIVNVDATNFTILDCNNRFTNVLGYAPFDLIGCNIFDYIETTFHSILLDYIENLETTCKSINTVLIMNNGNLSNVNLEISKIVYKNISRLILLFSKI